MMTSLEYKIKSVKDSNKGQEYNLVRVGISLNNSKHTGEKLETLLLWASQICPRVQIDIYDDIHAYNIQLEKSVSYEEAILLARKMGDEWIEKNHSVLSNFSNIPLNRFKDLSESRSLEKQLQELHDLYKSNALFAELINDDIDSFIIRLENRGSKISPQRKAAIASQSRKYIFAELALMSLLNEEENFAEVYAGRFLRMPTSPQRLKIDNLPIGLRNYHVLEVELMRRPERTVSQTAA